MRVFVLQVLLGYASIVETGIPVNAATVNPCAYAWIVVLFGAQSTSQNVISIQISIKANKFSKKFFIGFCLIFLLSRFVVSVCLLVPNKIKTNKK